MNTKVAIIGAGGKMGQRTGSNLKTSADIDLLCVENNPDSRKRLTERGFKVVEADEAAGEADVFVLAIPDKLIGKVTHQLVPSVRPGALIIGLDPAAAHAGELFERSDITYFITHPCHPILFNEKKPEELTDPDWFGGKHSPQSLVCAIHSGDSKLYGLGERIAREMFRPILRVHRISVEQMAILEPAVVETTTATLLYACRQAMDKGIEMGVPRDAAWDFVMGHIRVELAVIFGFADFPFSDGAIKAIEMAQKDIFQPDWMDRVFSKEAILQTVRKIADSNSANLVTG